MKFPLHLLIFVIVFSTISVVAQRDRDKGIEAYNQKDYNKAITLLASVTKLDKNDGEAWNFLGMSYLGASKLKESRKAFENAVKQKPQNAAFHINLAYINLLLKKIGNAEKEIGKAILLDSKNAKAFYVRGVIFSEKRKYDKAIEDADISIGLDKTLDASYLLKSNNHLYKFGEIVAKGGDPSENVGLLAKAVEALETCSINCSQSAFSKLQADFDDIKSFHTYFSNKKVEKITPADSTTPAMVDPSITPLEILSKPRASYTDSARQAGTQGTLTFAVLFSADGVTKRILVIKPLSNGLTENAIIAARRITFKPQMKDGKPVSIVKMLSYSFTLY